MRKKKEVKKNLVPRAEILKGVKNSQIGNNQKNYIKYINYR